MVFPCAQATLTSLLSQQTASMCLHSSSSRIPRRQTPPCKRALGCSKAFVFALSTKSRLVRMLVKASMVVLVGRWLLIPKTQCLPCTLSVVCPSDCRSPKLRCCHLLCMLNTLSTSHTKPPMGSTPQQRPLETTTTHRLSRAMARDSSLSLSDTSHTHYRPRRSFLMTRPHSSTLSSKLRMIHTNGLLWTTTPLQGLAGSIMSPFRGASILLQNPTIRDDTTGIAFTALSTASSFFAIATARFQLLDMISNILLIFLSAIQDQQHAL